MSPGLGSMALTAGKDREGLVPAKMQLHDRWGSQPLPHNAFQQGFRWGPNVVLAAFQRLDSREHQSHNVAPIMPQHLDKEEKWFCRSELKTPVRSSLHLGAQTSCHKNKRTDFQPRHWTCCHSLRLPGQWTLRGVIQKPGPWRQRTGRAPASSPL